MPDSSSDRKPGENPYFWETHTAEEVAAAEADAKRLADEHGGRHQGNGREGPAAQGRPAPPGLRPLELESLQGVRPRPVRWLAPRYIPLGKLVIVAGDGGHGKSALTLHLAASLSRGAAALGLDYAGPLKGETLLIQCEDDWGDTVVPRLLAFGADLSRIYRTPGIKNDKGELLPFSLLHYRELEKTLEARPEIRLVVIDPAGAYVGHGVDDHKEAELRALLGPLALLAARMRVTIVLVKHFNRAPTVKAIHRISASTGYANTVRAAFAVLPDEDDPDRFLFLPVKFNVGRRPRGLAVRRVSLTLDETGRLLATYPDLTAEDRGQIAEALFRFDWEGEVDDTADDVLAEARQAERRPSQAERCAAWLKEFLKDHAYPDSELKAAADKEGFTERMLRTAKTALRRGEPPLNFSNRGAYQGAWWNGLGDPETWVKRPEEVSPGETVETVKSGESGRNTGENALFRPDSPDLTDLTVSPDTHSPDGTWYAPDCDPACRRTPWDGRQPGEEE
jgi:hypothetical protein